MTNQTSALLEILPKIKRTKIAVVGDLMLDQYIWGDVARISPEAPVPVVEIASESTSLGGAANVSNNVHALGANTIPIGVVGNDYSGSLLRDLFARNGFETDGIIVDSSRQTTVKTRVIAHNQHVVRIDRETKQDISEHALQALLNYLESMIGELDAIIFEDYNKGLLTAACISQINAMALKNRVLVTVDPKYDNFWAYQNVAVFKPNRRETEAIIGTRLTDESDVLAAANRLMDRLHCQNVLITLGEQGLFLLESDGQHHKIPTRAKKVHDVSGAGDTVIGTLTAGLATGASISEAASLANFAAGVVVAELGAVPISPKKLRDAILMHDAERSDSNDAG
ncbi:D-glycero-beta-D-manno-heptose-7-phosphate kinase [candidate division KSB1 bacterium]|nr:D-glycero-beta-D-manno-heptose-7-phosphate kinase [candidate division KSB1 bacterium]